MPGVRYHRRGLAPQYAGTTNYRKGSVGETKNKVSR